MAERLRARDDAPVDSLILGVESSCDETAAAIVRHGRDVLSNVIASQHDLHAEYGGVVPEIASRAHVERILPVIRGALSEARVNLKDLSAVAVGARPGLIGSLLVGVAAAKALAWAIGRPIIGVDHIHAHLLSGLLNRDVCDFPALGLVVSGGHTSLYRVESPLAVRRLGSTIDDAVGEAFDKAAAILELGYPGGPLIERLAQGGDARAHDFPISRLGADSLDFSFSGLKTAALYAVRGAPQRMEGPPRWERAAADLSSREKADIAASFQRAAIAAVMLKVGRAADATPDARTLLIGGGVSANGPLRRELEAFARERALDLRLPAMEFCVDNAAMIAGLAHHRFAAGRFDDLSLAASPSSEPHAP